MPRPWREERAKAGGIDEGRAASPGIASPELRRALEIPGHGKFENGKFVMTPEPFGGIGGRVNEPRQEKGSEPPLPPEGGGNGARAAGGLLPTGLRRRILAAISGGSQGSAFAQARRELDAVVAAGGLPALEAPGNKAILTKGKEHLVSLAGTRVWKYQDGPALIPIMQGGKLAVREARATEYLSRLDLQNELFGDDLRVEGFFKGGKLVTSQSFLLGGQPSEREMTAMLSGLGWKRFPMNLQSLPHNLMATAWAHPGEGVVLVDARPPNFKKTESGAVLAIDLMLVEATEELLEIVKEL